MSLVSRPFSTGCGVLDEAGGARLVWGGGVEFPGSMGGGVCTVVSAMPTVLWLPRLSSTPALTSSLSCTSPVTAGDGAS